VSYIKVEDQRNAARRHYEKNRQTMINRAYAHKKAMIKRVQKIVRAKKDDPCTDCGVTYPYYVMQFDHVKGIKKFNLGDTSRWTSERVVLEELAKCEVVCANCHAERTHKRMISCEYIDAE
jgi:hypothetical protein